MKTRPLEIEEYKMILKLLTEGFEYQIDNKIIKFYPNHKTAIALILEANLGLRISDVLRLKLSNFKNGKLEIKEKKTGKLQYRNINPNVMQIILEYAIENKLNKDHKLIDVGVRTIQRNLKVVCNHLGLSNISTHSWRKLYATTQYELNNHNLELVKELLNHSSIATTQRYIRVSQKEINKASESFYIDIV